MKLFPDMLMEQVNENFNVMLVDSSNRDEITKNISGLVKSYMNRISYPVVKGDFINQVGDQLNKNGYAAINQYVPLDVVNKIKNFFEENGKEHPAHVPIYAKDGKNPYEGTEISSYAPDVTLQCREIFDLIKDPILLTIAMNYLGCFPTFYSINAMRTKPARLPYPDVQTNHRDYDCYRFLSCFLYLTDVGPENGPFTYYPGTHRGDRTVAANDQGGVPVCAPAGSIVLADVWGMHRGQVPKQDHRFLCWFRYGLGLPHSYRWDGNDKYKIENPDLLSEVEQEEWKKYLFRGFL